MLGSGLGLRKVRAGVLLPWSMVDERGACVMQFIVLYICIMFIGIIKPLCSKKRCKALSRLSGKEMKLGCRLTDREKQRGQGVIMKQRNGSSWGRAWCWAGV